MRKDAAKAGFHSHWAGDPEGRARGGTAILISNSSYNADDIKFEDHLGGACTTAIVSTHGHEVKVVCMYVPSDAKARGVFVQDLQAAQQDDIPIITNHSFVQADFNTVPDTRMDVYYKDGSPGKNYNPQNRYSTEIEDILADAGLEDVWREQNPTEVGHSRLGGTVLTRLDRWYAPSIEGWQYSAGIGTTGNYKSRLVIASDHQPVTLRAWLRVAEKKSSEPGLKVRNLSTPRSIAVVQEVHSSVFSGQGTVVDKWEEFKLQVVARLRSLDKEMEESRDVAEKKKNAEDDERKEELERIELALGTENDEGGGVTERRTLVEKIVKARTTNDYTECKGAVMRLLRACPGTKHFFQWAKASRKAERIEKLDVVDAWEEGGPRYPTEKHTTSDPKEMADEAGKYYTVLYSEPVAKSEQESQDRAAARAEYRKVLREGARLSAVEREKCEGRIKESEILEVCKHLPAGKSPGPDGIPNEFYTIHRELLTGGLTAALNEAHVEGKLPLTMREGDVSILYKKKERTDLRNYRPISLLQNDYKILTRVLTQRINKVIHLVVSPEQTGFVPGRFIVENTHLMNLLQAYVEGEDIEGMLVGIDFEKAFDSCSWSGLTEAMQDLGFGDDIVRWIATIYNSEHRARRRVRVNGERSEWYELERGVAQGCPVSPLLFLCMAEALSRLINSDAEFKGIIVGDNPREFRLSQFADDTIAILKNGESLPALWRVLHTFYLATGLKVNINKTEGLLLGRSRKDRANAPAGIKWVVDGDYITSLGAPLGYEFDEHAYMMTKYRKMRTRLAQWSGRIFMKTELERVQIANAMLLSLFWYQVQSLTPSKEVSRLINADCDKFIWGNNPRFNRKEDAESGRSWRAWVTKAAAVLPKREGGGREDGLGSTGRGNAGSVDS